jgi:hypothetical protein
METIRSIGASICITLVVTGIFSMLMPSRTMEKIIRFAVGLFFLSSLILPFASGDFSFDLSVPEWEDTQPGESLTQQVQNSTIRVSEQKVEELAESLLEAEGIVPQKVTATINIEQDNRITITKLSIVLGLENVLQKQKASDCLEEQMGIVPEFEIGEERIE